MYYKNYYAKLNSSQHISSPNRSLFLSVFKFPSPNNRFHLFINSILLLIDILWNLVPFFPVIPIIYFLMFFFFYSHCPTKAATHTFSLVSQTSCGFFLLHIHSFVLCFTFHDMEGSLPLTTTFS